MNDNRPEDAIDAEIEQSLGALAARAKARRRSKYQFTTGRMLAATIFIACACACVAFKTVTSTDHPVIAIAGAVATLCSLAAAWGMLIQGREGAVKIAGIVLLGLLWLPILLFCMFAAAWLLIVR